MPIFRSKEHWALTPPSLVDMSGGRAPGKNVTWSKPQEPAFLKAFKDKVGYREPVTIGRYVEAR